MSPIKPSYFLETEEVFDFGSFFVSWVQLTEVDEEAAVSFPLVVWHGHDTADVVLLLAVFLFGKVTHQVTSFLVVLKNRDIIQLIHLLDKL